MVEGPGCTLNGEKIRSRVQKGQKVTAVVAQGGPNGVCLQSFTGCQYTGVETLGKELFIYFGQRALRFHFGMNGSMRINPSDKKDRSGKGPAVEVHLIQDIICFYETAVEIRLSEECEQKVRTMESLDVCSAMFSVSRACEAVQQQKSRMLCDVLLDQAVLPGVGNIIKNEALFDCGLGPAVKVSQLTDGQIHQLVKMTRDFTLLFYKCRRTGSALQKHCRVYKRTSCGHCAGTVTVCRLGENGRMTYFCQCCQSEDPVRVNQSRQACGSSLLNWVSGGHAVKEERGEQEEWSCELCTLINQPCAEACEACLSPRPYTPKPEPSAPASPITRDLIRFPHIPFSKPQVETKVTRRAAFGTSTLIFTHLEPSHPLTDVSKQGKTSPNYVPGASVKRSLPLHEIGQQAPRGPPSKKTRTDGGSDAGNEAWNSKSSFTGVNSNLQQTALPLPCCPAHSRPCVLRVVRKEGENRGRRFYACSLPQGKQCEHFQWADLHFPLCEHGKRCLLRTVLKLGPNNGRDFYTCPLPVGKQCRFFLWASGAGAAS